MPGRLLSEMANTFDEDEASSEENAWRPTNVADTTAVASARALRQIITGGIVAALWGLCLLGCVALRTYGIVALTSVYWDVGGGLALLIALGAAARSRASMAILSLLVAADLPVQMSALHDAMPSASVGRTLAIARLCVLPFVLFFVSAGYRAAVDYHLLRNRSLPKNWRFWAPLQLVGGVVAYVGFVLVVVLFWKGPMRASLESAGATIRTDRRATPLMQALYADLHSIDVKPFRTLKGEKKQSDASLADSGNKAGKRNSPPAAPAAAAAGAPVAAPAAAQIVDLASLPKPLRDAVEEATKFAAQVDQVGCLGESLRRRDTCKDDDCLLLAKVFMTACLPASRPSRDFCTGVPSPVSVVETMTWQRHVCDQSASTSEPCHVFFLSLQNFCHPELLAQTQ